MASKAMSPLAFVPRPTLGGVRIAAPPARHCRSGRKAVAPRAGNFVVELLGSAAVSSVVLGVTVATHPERDAEIERITAADVPTLLPLGAAVLADATAHSIPGLGALLSLVSEPAGAAAGVAYMMSLLLAAQAIDPATLAPKGTVLNVETAKDNSAAVRKPFLQIVPTALQVIDWENEGSSGKGWDPKEGLPKLPLNSVLIVVGVGSLILEAASHAPVLSLFMPRVLTLACWYAAAGWAFSLAKKD